MMNMQLGSIEVLIEISQLHCLGIGRNADDWLVVLVTMVSALYGASAAALYWKDPSQDVGLVF